MNLKYDNVGCLLPGIYDLSLDEIEHEFVVGKSKRRHDIFEKYKYHLNEIKDTNCCLNHWIDGSFVTLKENPDDIDTLTEFDGVKAKKLGILDEIDNIIYDAPFRTNNFCHSFRVFKVPQSWKKDYDEYIKIKSRILFILFPSDSRTGNVKGFLKLKMVS